MKKYLPQFALFGLAFVIFYIGLGVGLQFNPTLGSALWLLSALLVVIGVAWAARASSSAGEE